MPTDPTICALLALLSVAVALAIITWIADVNRRISEHKQKKLTDRFIN